MKRIVLVSFVAAVATSLVASPSFAVTPVDSLADNSARVLVAGDEATEGSPAAIYVPADDLAQQLRDKMPYISQAPRVVGNDLVWTVNVSPMRLKAKKGVSLLDRLSGQVTISKPGVDIAGLAFEADSTGKVLFTKTVTPRLITTDGEQQVRVTLPKDVAAQLRSLPTSKLLHRVLISMTDEKDTNAATPGYDRRQLTNTLVPPAIANYLAGRRTAVKPGSVQRAAGNVTRRSQPMKQQTNTPGTIVIYNGSPFNLNVAGNAVQCQVPFSWLAASPGSTLASNTSIELFGVSQVSANSGTSYWYVPANNVNAAAQKPGDVVGKQALDALSEGGLVAHITDSFTTGLATAFESFAVGLVLDGVFGMIAAISTGNNQCTDAGSAMTFAWSNASLGANQTAGNINYWVPSFGRTSNMGPGVQPTSIPAVAPGSPLTGYNATSANGLAVTPAVLQRELGLGGTVTLATLNSPPKNGAAGSVCVYTNQQVGNPASSNTNSQYGSTSLGGGTTADWGPCVNTTDPADADYNSSYYFVSGPGSELMNRGVTIMIGYSTTAYATAGPSPALPPTTAASSTACVATTAPCAYLQPASGSTPPAMGCTPGTWTMLTPWYTNQSMNLSSPPSAYNASSLLNTQIGFTGVTAAGTPVTMFAPANLGGSVTSNFSPTTVNPWPLTPANLAGVQQALGGPGGYVTQWLCVMTAKSSIPSGIPTSTTAMNLGWYGVPVVVPIANPAGNAVSPPA